MTMAVSPESSAPQAGKGGMSRRHARQLALQMLFQHEFQDRDPSWQDKFWSGQSVSPDGQAFTMVLVNGVLTHQQEIDQLIRQFAVGWSLERMPVVDRNILRCAIFELLWEPDIPPMVTINEAVELAKRFADDEARKFVNGLLDHILRDDPRLLEKRNQIKSKSTPA
jgi:transcription antitermination protein NusB